MQREPEDWKPRAWRQRASLVGVGEWEDGTTARVLISNISYHGCQLWTDHELCAGETIALTIPDKGTINGQVRWIRGGTAGVRLIGDASAVDARRARLGF